MFLIVRVFPTSKGDANVTINDSIFQQSSPIRHAVELMAINKRFNRKPEAFTLVFTDGGSDHKISFINVRLSWLAYFLLIGVDSLRIQLTRCINDDWHRFARGSITAAKRRSSRVRSS